MDFLLDFFESVVGKGVNSVVFVLFLFVGLFLLIAYFDRLKTEKKIDFLENRFDLLDQTSELKDQKHFEFNVRFITDFASEIKSVETKKKAMTNFENHIKDIHAINTKYFEEVKVLKQKSESELKNNFLAKIFKKYV